VSNRNYLHVTAATAGATINGNPGAILGGLYINIVPSAATSSILTIFDGPVASNKVIAVCNVQNANIPGFVYDLVAAGGLFYTYVQTGAVTTVGDFTITHQ
jgi:hypothetical protein